jgi:hypothetical protein
VRWKGKVARAKEAMAWDPGDTRPEICSILNYTVSVCPLSHKLVLAAFPVTGF